MVSSFIPISTKAKREKLRIHLDSNESNRFDKNDLFLGRTGLRAKHSKNDVGGILDEGVLGQLEVKFKRLKPSASKKSADDPDGLFVESNGGVGDAVGNMASDVINLESLSLAHPDGSFVAAGIPLNISPFY